MKDDHGTWTTMTMIAFTMYQEGPPGGSMIKNLPAKQEMRA